MVHLRNRYHSLMVKLTVCLFIFPMVPGCGGQLQQLAVETMANAQSALTSANAMGAETAAVTSLRTAEEMLTSAGNAMNAGDAEQAYRLALRSYLHARIATETAIAAREEARLGEAQKQLAASKQRVAEALQRLAAIKAELEALEE